MGNGAQELQLFEYEGGPMIQVEVNLEEAPLFASNRRNRDEKSIEARATVLTPEGNRIEQYWEIIASTKFGLPGPLDQDVFVAVMRLVGRLGGIPADGKIRFSVYELLELMGRTHAAGNYKDVRSSLDRLAATSIYAENAFYSKEDEDFKSLRFTLWDVGFRRRRRKGQEAEGHTLKFSEVVARSYNTNYLKSLDPEFYYSLDRDLAKSLYRLVDVKRKDAFSWSVDLEQLRQLIAMPPSYKHPSTIKRQLEPAHRELVEKGFLNDAEVEERGKGRAKKHIVRYRVSQKFVRERAKALPDLSERERFAANALMSHGVSPHTAGQLVREHGASLCAYYVAALPHQKKVSNPAGWLIRFIEHAWPVQIPDEAGTNRNTPPAGEARQNHDPQVPLIHNEEASSAAAQALTERQRVKEDIRRRLSDGDFDEAIKAFETYPYEEYSKLVGTKVPVKDAEGNRYYVSLDGDLHVYVGGTSAKHRYYLLTLDRS